MTWYSRSGAIYEQIDTYFIKADSVTFRHRFGTARLLINELADESRRQLIDSYQATHALEVLPKEDASREVRPFEVEAA